MVLCQDVELQRNAGSSRRLHTCPKCEDLWSMRHGIFNCLEFACGTGASCVYLAQTLGKRARVIGASHPRSAMHS